MSVAELPAADPLTDGLTVVACQLLTKQRRLPDDVDGAGIQRRRRSLRLRRSSVSCTGLGNSDEANSGEQRNDETHRYTLHGATAPCRRRPRDISQTHWKAMSQVDSRYNGCVVFGCITREKLSRSCVSWANSILAAFEMSLCCAIPVRQSLPTIFKKTI
jgi:hypothetical protein